MRFGNGFAGGNCSDCSWVSAEGEITADSAAALELHLQQLQREWQSDEPVEGIWLFINSPGGDVEGALRLGRLIRSRRINVRVARTVPFPVEGAGREFQTGEPGTCASACALVLMGGVERQIEDDSRVGVHQFSSSRSRLTREQETISSTQYTVAELSAYAAEMGVSPTLIALASATPPSSMLWLSQEQLERSKLVTNVSRVPDSPWELRVNGPFLSAFASQPQAEGGVVHYLLRCREPGAWSMTILFEAPGEIAPDRRTEIAESLESANIAPGEWNHDEPLLGPIRGRGEVIEANIAYSFSIPASGLTALAAAQEQQWLYLDMPNAYRSELMGGFVAISRSNLLELVPHLQRSCR
jgi:hypothetical protein